MSAVAALQRGLLDSNGLLERTFRDRDNTTMPVASGEGIGPGMIAAGRCFIRIGGLIEFESGTEQTRLPTRV